MKYLVMVQGAQVDYDAMGGKDTAQSPVWSEQDPSRLLPGRAER
ncbi:hypothetical protein [Streptomyces solicathayae]|uniref:Uncharacterized protein n=1 Tax=Streptomyces solicathayae TaxID=3081768 RepID=A0ABZ0M5N6_9ACTN|nr:hypothetical protein [Streptomyces sp. HUAS YS2]WOX26867.1 hypothetical protein R2D22_04385 [Streptomyces sp. HUAS YS2]